MVWANREGVRGLRRNTKSVVDMDKRQKLDVWLIHQRDLEILNANAEQLNREVLDTLEYQVSLEVLLEELPGA